MKGVVEAISRRNGMAVVRLERGDYMVLEPFSCDFVIGETLTGLQDEHGGQYIHFTEQGVTEEVYVQAIQATRESALNLIR